MRFSMNSDRLEQRNTQQLLLDLDTARDLNRKVDQMSLDRSKGRSNEPGSNRKVDQMNLGRSEGRSNEPS